MYLLWLLCTITLTTGSEGRVMYQVQYPDTQEFIFNIQEWDHLITDCLTGQPHEKRTFRLG